MTGGCSSTGPSGRAASIRCGPSCSPPAGSCRHPGRARGAARTDRSCAGARRMSTPARRGSPSRLPSSGTSATASAQVRRRLSTRAVRPPCAAWSSARSARDMFAGSFTCCWATPIFTRSAPQPRTVSRSWCALLRMGTWSSTRPKEDEVAVQTKVKLLTDRDVPFEELVPGLELARAITSAGSTQLGGGYMRFTEDAEFAGWTLTYDEVLFVQAGELTVASDGANTVARAGGALLIPNGAKVTYPGKAGTVSFFVLVPFDWHKKVDRLTKSAHTAPTRRSSSASAPRPPPPPPP